MNRREALQRALAALAAGFPAFAAAQPPGKPRAFDYAWLKGRARALARAPYRAPSGKLPEALAGLDWDRYQRIRFDPAHALWRGQQLRFQVRFFHLGLFFHDPVRVHELIDGQSRTIAYDPKLFDYGASGLAGARLRRDLGFAGVQIFFHTDPERDVAAFLGASYFRAVGGEMQYGLSARGLAIDTGMAKPEEFPRFTDFWLERPRPQSDRLTVYALLDSPSIAGACRFDLAPAATQIMDVDAALYPRSTVGRLGVAPLTSMFDYGENDRRAADDWRPELHDSDGLALWTGAGEWIWRPLVNPAALRFNAYANENPRGFGLLQRDRNFDHYQDDGAFYDRRPSLWVEPKGAWGKGAVQLVELPAADETSDNIVAFWNPQAPPRPGEELLFGYRLYWGERMPFGSPLAQVVATRTGIGGIVGRKREYFSWRFVVDFAGANLAMIGDGVKVEPVITASRGTVQMPAVRPLESIRGYRASFDLRPPGSDDPIDLRLYLSAQGQPLSETWLYQWTPPADRSRYLG